jgi:hypothetical protein
MGSKLISSYIPMQLVGGGQKARSSRLAKLGPDPHFDFVG